MMSCCNFFNIERFGSGSSSTFIVIISHSLSRIFHRKFGFSHSPIGPSLLTFLPMHDFFSSMPRSFVFV
ncbi:hypothetical protein Hanom_Chr09g00831551 [Helianthus anomalus]